MSSEKTMKQEYCNDNHAMFSGVIVNRYENEKTVSFTVVAKDNGRGTKTYSNYPRVFFFKEDHPEVEEFLLHENVTIHAHFTARYRKDHRDKTYIMQGLVGDGIEHSQSEVKKYFGNDFGRDDYENIVRVAGIVLKVRNSQDKCIKINIKVKRGKYVDDIMVVSFRPEDSLINPGEKIVVYGKVNTQKKDVGGQIRSHESIVVSRLERKDLMVKEYDKKDEN